MHCFDTPVQVTYDMVNTHFWMEIILDKTFYNYKIEIRGIEE